MKKISKILGCISSVSINEDLKPMLNFKGQNEVQIGLDLSNKELDRLVNKNVMLTKIEHKDNVITAYQISVINSSNELDFEVVRG